MKWAAGWLSVLCVCAGFAVTMVSKCFYLRHTQSCMWTVINLFFSFSKIENVPLYFIRSTKTKTQISIKHFRQLKFLFCFISYSVTQMFSPTKEIVRAIHSCSSLHRLFMYAASASSLNCFIWQMIRSWWRFGHV